MTFADAATVAQLTPAQKVGLTLYGEARGNSTALRLAIASVIGNRARTQPPRWGQTPAEACLWSGAFSCWSPSGGVQNHQVVMNAVQLLLAGGPVVAASLKACLALGAEVVAGALADTVHGATFYYSPAGMVPRNRVPAWAVGLEPVAVIDGTRFFAGVA